uniref:MS148 n=1 Tax=Microscilla sp. PRE1 TaxID=155537 RepID=Q93P83_9BACT|nr:PAS domain-containing protein [Microscilla sp. PRE1]AAK62870.1 MS148 [Microscilla sp. PRE1]
MSDLLGKSDFDFFGEHARNAYEDEQQIIRTKQPLINQVEQEDKKDGHVSYVSTTKLPLRNHEGQVIGTFGISRDVSRLVMMEKELEQCKEKLHLANEKNPNNQQSPKISM